MDAVMRPESWRRGARPLNGTPIASRSFAERSELGLRSSDVARREGFAVSHRGDLAGLVPRVTSLAPDQATPTPLARAAFEAWTTMGLLDVLATATESRPPPASVNPEDAPDSALWSHRFAVARAPDHFELFDHLWASPALASQLSTPTIHRRGSWTRDGSDHDPVSVTARLA